MSFRHILVVLFISCLPSQVIGQSFEPAIVISEQKTHVDGKPYYVHTVQQGQTFFSISRAYNTDIQSMIYAGEMSKLHPGDTILIPVVKVLTIDIPYGEHEVQIGETLYGISRYYFLKEEDIIEINTGLSAENLQAGSSIKIPLTMRNKAILAEIKPQKDKEQIKEKGSYVEQSSTVFVEDQNNFSKEVNATSLNVAMMLPLRLSQLSELHFTEFDISRKKGIRYPSFEYLQFYEGARIALDILEKRGYQVSLYVYDVNESDPAAMAKLLQRKELRQMDLIIPLVFSSSFQEIATFAKKQQIPVVNPLTSRSAMLLDNPYLFKIMPSNKVRSSAVLRYISSSYVAPHIILLHSPGTDKNLLQNYTRHLEGQSKISWKSVAYDQISSVTSSMVPSKNNIVIALIEKDNEKENEALVSGFVSRFSSQKDLKLTLFAPYEWLSYPTIDYAVLERMNMHFEFSRLDDFSNQNFASFAQDFQQNYKTNPAPIYASLGYDLMLFFVSAMAQDKACFMENPNMENQLPMINTMFFKKSGENGGYENQKTLIYRLLNYKISLVGS